MTISNIIYNLETLAMIFGVLIAGGFIAYKMKFADSWEGGVKLLLKTYWDWIKKIGKFLYEEFLGRSPDSQIINPALILTNKEAIELTNRFKGCPYDMPFLEQFLPNCNGILWMEIVSAGLCASYENLSFSDLKRIAISTIGNFYYEIKGLNFGGQIVNSPKVENYPGLESISGSKYSMNLLNQAMKLGAETASERVKEVREENGIKIIVTDQKEYPCKAVILATGVAHRHLGIPQEEALAGSGVSYCATCDGAFFRGKDVAVIGGGNTALQDAEFLSNYCNKVYVVHRRDEFRGESNLVDVLKEKDNVEFVLDSIVKDIEGKFMVERLFLRNKKTGEDFHIPVSGVFVAIGQIPQNEIFDGLVRLDENGFILASEDCMTSHPGIFAAGDCRTKEVRQLTTAAADGSVAALAACKYLSMNF